MRQRLEYMDLLKCFAIFSVLLGHATEQLSGGLFCFWSGHLTVYEKPTHVIDLATGSFDWGNLGLTGVAPLLAVAELTICYNLVRLLRKTRILRLLILGEKESMS